MTLNWKSTVLLAFIAALSLAACSDDDKRFNAVDKDGVPLDKGKKECKEQAKAQAAGVAKGDITNGVADDLYSDCLYRRGYFKQ